MRLSVLLLVLALGGCKEDIVQNVDAVALSPDSVGHFCQMNILEHGGPKAQIHLEGLPGTPLFFSQVRDAVNYMRLPEQTHTILAVWVNDMGAPGANWADPGARNWIGLEEAFLVVGSTREGGMGAPELVPFSTEQAAIAFTAQHGGSIMRLAEVPDEAVTGPGELPQQDDEEFEKRLRSLSNRSEG